LKRKDKYLKWSIVNQKAAKWCFDRGYRIYPKPIEFGDPDKYGNRRGLKFKLVVDFAGDKKMGSKEYTQREWPIAVWSVYNYLYNKHSGKKT
jgi:hypothetical protein